MGKVVIKKKLMIALLFLFLFIFLIVQVKAIQVNLISPANDTRVNETSQSFRCNVTSSGENITFVIFKVWNSDNSTIYNENFSAGNNSNFSDITFNYSLPYNDLFFWNCVGYENSSAYNSAPSNFQIRLFGLITDGLWNVAVVIMLLVTIFLFIFLSFEIDERYIPLKVGMFMISFFFIMLTLAIITSGLESESSNYTNLFNIGYIVMSYVALIIVIYIIIAFIYIILMNIKTKKEKGTLEKW